MSTGRKIVVGMDASPEARVALEWAGLVARPQDELVVVHAYTTPVSVTPAYIATLPPVPLDDFRELAVKELDRLVGGISDERIHPWVVEGRPGPSIVAEGADADLVVVGHRGESQMSMMLGSTANYVLHHATCPVVVVHGMEPEPPRLVVVGVDDHHLEDGSSASVRALRWAYGLDGVEEVRVVHVWSLYPLAWDLSGTVIAHTDDFVAGARGVVERQIAAAGPPPSGLRVTSQITQGLPAKALLDASGHADGDTESATDAADLIVVGTRGRGGFSGLVLGSTSTEVAAHSRVPVAVVR